MQVEKKKMVTGGIAALDLVNRSPCDSEGWSPCAPVIFRQLAELMPTELLERKTVQDKHFVRLTEEAKAVLRWSK